VRILVASLRMFSCPAIIPLPLQSGLGVNPRTGLAAGVETCGGEI